MDQRGAGAESGAQAMVRPFVLTGGRTRSGRGDLRMETMVESGRHAPSGDLPEHAAILAACSAGPVSIAEISAHTGLGLGVTTVLVGDLLEEGLVDLHQTDPTDIEVSALTRMIERVKSL